MSKPEKIEIEKLATQAMKINIGEHCLVQAIKTFGFEKTNEFVRSLFNRGARIPEEVFFRVLRNKCWIKTPFEVLSGVLYESNPEMINGESVKAF